MSERLGEAFVEVLADSTKFGSGLADGVDKAVGEAARTASQRMADITRNVEDGLRSAGEAAGRTGRTLSRTVTAPLVGLGVGAVKTAMDFETSFAQIEGLVGVSGQDLEDLRQSALRLGPAYGVSATDAADALFFITSAGLRGSEATDVLEASLRGAVVGLGDVSTIADLATSAMNAYGSDILSAKGATDVLTSAVREGKLEPAELAGAMGQVLPIASAMGIGFDEVGAAFAAMSRTGTNASAASTQLRGIMTSILKPTNQAEEALAEMGLSSAGLKEQIREEGLLSVLETLTDAFADNEVGAEQVFGNVRALSGVMDLMGANADGTREIFGSLTESTGLLDEAFDVAADTSGHQLAVAMQEAKSSLMDLGNTLLPIFVNDVMPVLQDFGETLKDLAARFRELDPAMQRKIVAAAGIVAALGPVLIVVGSVLKAVASIVGVFGKFVRFMPKVFRVLNVLRIAVLTNPIFLIAALVIGIIAVLWHFREQIIDALVGAWEWVKEKFQQFWDWFTGAVSAMVESVTEFFSSLAESVRERVQAMVEFVTDLWDRLREAVSNAVGSIRDFVVGTFQNLVDGVRTMFQRFWDFYSGIWRRIFDMVRTVVTNIREAVTGGFQNAVDGARERFNSLVDFVRGIPRRVLDALGNVGSLLKDAGKNILQGLWDGMREIWDRLTGWVGGLGDRIRNLKGPLSYDKIMLTDIGEAIIGGLGTGMQSEFRNVEKMLSGMTASIPITAEAAGLSGLSAISASPVERAGTSINVTINNPEPEPASQSTSRELRKLAAIGVFGD
jgi:TP901 family phage tail tape measure protein